MRPVFTVHGGEYLTAEHLEHKFGKKLRVWVPSKDDGIDLLVSSRDCRKAVSLQVKSSKSYELKTEVNASGWWRIDAAKLQKSTADYWVFVILPVIGKGEVDSPSFMVIRPKELLKRLKAAHGSKETYDVYFTIRGNTAIETRGMTPQEIRASFEKPPNKRDFSVFLEAWAPALETVL